LFGLHAALTLSEETLDRIAASRAGLPIHVHACESAQDEEECLAAYGERVISRFDRHGLVTEGALFAHAVACDDAELDILAARGATVAVNPTSNMANGVGLPDVGKMLAKGIRVILGDDGVSASAATEIRNLFFTMKLRGHSPLAFSEADLLKVVRNTYDFVGERLGAKLGRILPGYAADLLVVDYLPPSPLHAGNATSHFLYGLAPAFRPRDVFARGVRAIAEGVPDARLLRRAEHAREAASDVWNRIMKEE
jgi:cytosine/adenosine deaminase-related metal-dependent hydrolase